RVNISGESKTSLTLVGMLQRTKYNRFRNDSVTSVDDLIHNLSMNSKVSAVATTSTAPSYLVSPEVLRKDQEDGPTTLCTLIHKVSHLKLSHTGSLLGIKNLSSAVRELAVSKLQGNSSASSSAAGASDNTCNLVSATSCSQQDVINGLNSFFVFVFVFFSLQYLGCIEVLRSMRSLDFNTRTQITR
uniref:PID domain-containing protein n=1 Tax=Anas platyrhynchos TaxID=8839 RepID=A0A8B9QTM7_ANAPL